MLSRQVWVYMLQAPPSHLYPVVAVSASAPAPAPPLCSSISSRKLKIDAHAIPRREASNRVSILHLQSITFQHLWMPKATEQISFLLIRRRWNHVPLAVSRLAESALSIRQYRVRFSTNEVHLHFAPASTPASASGSFDFLTSYPDT